MNAKQIQDKIDKLNEQRHLHDYDEALETELYVLIEKLSDAKRHQNIKELAIFIAKENKWT